MKTIKLLAFLLICVMVGACNNDEKMPSDLAMSGLAINSGDVVNIPGTISFSANIKDNNIKLSTLEVSVALADNEILHKSIRTKGNEVHLTDESIDIPFLANMDNGTELKITFEAINVDGNSVTETKTVTVKRPEIPQTLYMVLDGNTYEMTPSENNPYLYVTDASGLPTSGKAKVYSNGDDLEKSEYIWTGTISENIATIGEFGGDDITVSFLKYLIEQYTFNTLTFEVGVIGQELDLKINGIDFNGKDGYMYALANLVNGETVTLNGFDDVEGVYNRDFFSYENGTLTFVGETGELEIYYSPKYNYLWVNRMTDVAPNCLWIVGHGFICAPKWNEDFNDDGWSTDDPARMGYARKIDSTKYQCTMYINTTHVWESFEFEIYSDREWNKTNGLELESISGAPGFAISGSKGITNTPGYADFTPGYYKFTFDTSTNSAFIEKAK